MLRTKTSITNNYKDKQLKIRIAFKRVRLIKKILQI